MSATTAKVTRAIIAAAVMAGAAAFPFVVDDSDTVRMVSLGLIMAIGAMGLNILTGYTGQISIGHAGFYLIGSYLTASLMVDANLTFFATIPIAVLAAGVAGAIVALPALRVKGPALALVTLGFAILVPTLLRRFAADGNALWEPKRSHLRPMFDGLTSAQWRYLVPLVFLIAVYALTRNIVHSRAGRSLIAVRDQEVAASTAGINVAVTKIIAFAISAAYCGLAGSLSVLVRGQASAPEALVSFQMSIYFLIAVVIGGTATVAGPVIGAILVEALSDKAGDWAGGNPGMAPFILGSSLVLIVYFLPGGVVGGYRRLKATLRPTPTPAASANDPSPQPHSKGEAT